MVTATGVGSRVLFPTSRDFFPVCQYLYGNKTSWSWRSRKLISVLKNVTLAWSVNGISATGILVKEEGKKKESTILLCCYNLWCLFVFPLHQISVVADFHIIYIYIYCNKCCLLNISVSLLKISFLRARFVSSISYSIIMNLMFCNPRIQCWYTHEYVYSSQKINTW